MFCAPFTDHGALGKVFTAIFVTARAVAATGFGKSKRSFLGLSGMKEDKLKQHERTMLQEMKAKFENFKESASELIKQSSDSISLHVKIERDGSLEEMSAL